VLDPPGSRRLAIPQGRGLPGRRLPPSHFAKRRPAAAHACARRQRDQGGRRWTRLYHPAIYDHATTASYIYEAHLRHELTRRLGVEWQETRKGIAEIEGFADEHLRVFSTRRKEILEAAGENASARSMQVATLATRKPKDPDIGKGELLERWRSKAQEIGLDREAIEQTFDPAARRWNAAESHRVLFEGALGRKVTKSASHFDRRDAIRAVADSLREGAPGAEVERLADEFLASEDVIQIGASRNGPRYTTQRIWELEREALAAVERMKAEGPPAAGELIAARVISERPTLKDDQRALLQRLLRNPEGVVVVIGEAGTGKTYGLVAAAEGWAQAGIPVQAAAPTWRAADVMAAEGLSATTVASLLARLDRAERESQLGLADRSVLLVDEAGMVDSADLARLIEHARAAEAKLVLLGDPEQLGEIEVGGLFRAVTDRTEPAHLSEVIRHEHELEREAARLIREGEGREALRLYEAENRVTVAQNAEERREAMVRDWQESFAKGEDAMMIAKRNVEVAKLNELAREIRRQEGQLGAEEIEVGDATFAAGDQVITRVNDRGAEVSNRERWEVTEVDTEAQSVVLEGIDQAKRVELGPDYLSQANPYSDAPALEHAYAVTTYSAQGSTVDRAFVAADPSMDKQKLYVATSRSRGETRLYATPEIQTHREEIAPTSPHAREGIPHIAEAAERDRAQLAAHEVSLRSRFEGLPSEELVARHRELERAADREKIDQERHDSLRERIERGYDGLARNEEARRTAEVLGRRERREELAQIEAFDRHSRRQLERHEAELARMPVPSDAARRELAVADQVLVGRERLAIAAARAAPPPYIKAELGERPSDPAKQRVWDRAVADIEGFRLRNGIKDPKRALGREVERTAQRERQRQTQRQIREANRQLGRGEFASRSRSIERGGLSIGR
jgi:AAA domain/TrwC relaxase